MTILEESGLFWWHDEPVPDGHFAPETSVTGFLKITDDGQVTLELDGFLTTPENPLATLLDKRGEIVEDRCIEGILKTSSDRVLLAGLIKSGGRFNSNGMCYEAYAALDCLVGREAFPVGTGLPPIHSLKIDLVGFEEWLQLDGITFEQSGTSRTATYKDQDDAVYAVEDGTIAIRFHIETQFPGHPQGSAISFNVKADFIYDLNTKEDIGAIRARHGLVEDFFILLTGVPYAMDWPRVSLSENTYYRWYFMRHKNKKTNIAPSFRDCLTFFPKLRNSFGELWAAWKNKREEFGPGFYLYFGTRRGVPLFAEHKFVNLVWGIEALHRKKHPSIETEAHHEKITQILDAVPKEYKKWLGGKLKYSYEPTLEVRIFESLGSLQLGFAEENLRKFAHNCADRRNEISHHGGHGKISGESYKKFVIDLDRKSSALSTLYHALLLHEIGIADDILRSWIYEGFQSYPIKACFVQVGLLDKGAIAQKTAPPQA